MRRAPRINPGTDRAALRFARVPQQRKGCGAHPEPIQEPIAPRSVLREFLRSAKGAARTPRTNPGTDRAALRFARVPQERKGCGAHPPEPIQEPIAPRSVLREFLRSAKGAARTPNQSRNRSRRAPYRVLAPIRGQQRERCCASSSGAQRVRRAPRINPGTDRAALRFARVPQESRLIKRA